MSTIGLYRKKGKSNHKTNQNHTTRRPANSPARLAFRRRSSKTTRKTKKGQGPTTTPTHDLPLITAAFATVIPTKTCKNELSTALSETSERDCSRGSFEGGDPESFFLKCRPLKILGQVQYSIRGLQAWRQLSALYVPRTEGRSSALLSAVMQLTKDKTLLEQIILLERLSDEYTKSPGHQVAPNILLSTLVVRILPKDDRRCKIL